jgi:glycosyltransferase involved in cell wall biosynthesis
MRIAYIVSRFPHLPETFILREIVALEKLGWKIELYPMIYQNQEIVHEQAIPWLHRAHRLPWLSVDIILANLNELVNRPGLYLSLWIRVISENVRSLKFLSRAIVLFPKAVLMAKMLRDDGIKHVHAHYATHTALVAWIIHKLTNISYSVTVHAHDIFVEKAMLVEKLRSTIQIVAISEYNKNYLSKTIGTWINDKTQVIRCGVDPTLYSASRSSKKNKVFEVISVGSLQPYKGHKFLVQACVILRDRNVPFRCRIIGGGELYPELLKMIHAHSLTDVVQLLGSKNQDDVAHMLSEADCYVQPSVVTPAGKMEGIPVALMEAMASKIPVIATEISGIPELVIDGETGWLVPPDDAVSLADAMEDIFNHPDEANKRSTMGFNRVLSEFVLSTNVKKLSNLFLQFVN